MAISVWGTKANGGTYAAIAALTNIPATLFATLVYELVFWDSSRGMYPSVLTLCCLSHHVFSSLAPCSTSLP